MRISWFFSRRLFPFGAPWSSSGCAAPPVAAEGAAPPTWPMMASGAYLQGVRRLTVHLNSEAPASGYSRECSVLFRTWGCVGLRTAGQGSTFRVLHSNMPLNKWSSEQFGADMKCSSQRALRDHIGRVDHVELSSGVLAWFWSGEELLLRPSRQRQDDRR